MSGADSQVILPFPYLYSIAVQAGSQYITVKVERLSNLSLDSRRLGEAFHPLARGFVSRTAILFSLARETLPVGAGRVKTDFGNGLITLVDLVRQLSTYIGTARVAGKS